MSQVLFPAFEPVKPEVMDFMRRAPSGAFVL